MHNLPENPTVTAATCRRTSFRAFTLLELLIVLVLMATLLVGLSSMIRLFSRSYASNERRVGRAQLARSISQMLSDDLGAAIQDPILAVDVDPTRQYVRHFGLRGDSRSLQIDVVQPSAFVLTADTTENRRIIAGGEKKLNSKQVPELKTIFYEFVPLNAVQKLPGDPTSDSADSTLSTDGSGTDMGSQLAGSLAGGVDVAAAGLNGLAGDIDDYFWDGMRPFEQKFGLSRRELDYETPEEESADSSTSAFGATDADVSTLAGSLAAAPDASGSAFSAGAAALAGSVAGLVDETTATFKPPLTAAQIAMDCDDGTTWAPEVLDCRFSYFDGDVWYDSWDSLEKNGLPIAIKVELKLAPLADVDLYRASPLIQALPLAPSVETLAKLRQEARRDAQADDGVNSSRLAGSLLGGAGSSVADSKPVDVFNSYRTPIAIKAAYIGRPASAQQSASPFAQMTQSSSLATETTSDASTANVDLGVGGGLNSDSTPLAGEGLAGSLGETFGAGIGGSGDSFMDEAQALVASGAIYNEDGVCVDFSNDGSYITLEGIAAEIGVKEPDFYEVVAFLPTTPYSRAKTVQRRQPATVRRGNVAVANPRGESSGARRAAGQNPYATGVARAPRERQTNERTVSERQTRESRVNDRNVANRGPVNRAATNERSQNNRASGDRQANDRGGVRERVQNDRGPRERVALNGGTLPFGDELVDGNGGGSRGGRNAGGAGNAVDAFGGVEIAGSTAPGPGLGGGNLGATAPLGGGTATTLGPVDPFEIVNQSSETLPFADSAFAAVDASMGLTTMSGLIANPSGVGTTQTPSPTVSQPQKTGQKQTWIRGKK